MSTLRIYAPSGVVPRAAELTLAARRLRALGYSVDLDEAARGRRQRFAGSDDERLAAIRRTAEAAPSVALAARGGYGLTRLLPAMPWRAMARSVEQGTRWVGYSDLTALQLGLLAATGASSWAGPCAIDDFSRADTAGGVDEVTRDCFHEAMGGELEAVGFRTEAGFDGLGARGTLWGGNLTMLCSLLGTPWLPQVKRGILFLEDVGEHPYRIERMLLQLVQAGIVGGQKAVVLGHFSHWKAAPLDRGYGPKSMLAAVRAATQTPVLTGLPFGHVHTKVTLPVGRRAQLVVSGRDVLIGWA